MEFPLLCGAAVLCLVSLVILRQLREEYARFLSATACCLFVPVGLGYVREYFSLFFSLAENSPLSRYLPLLCKAVGIAFLGATVASLCRDCNEGPLGEKLLFCSRCAILSLSLPVAKELIEQALSLL